MLVVTGGAGFIGSALIGTLNKRGRNDILVVDNFAKEGKWKNLRGKHFLQLVNPDVFVADLEKGCYDGRLDGVLHIGAITDTSEPDADALYERNTSYTHRLATWAIDRKVRFVYASSASVYGDGDLGFSDDDVLTPDLLPMNPYAFSKWLSDMETIREGWTNKIAGLRFFNVFGPNEYHKGRMASVIWHATNQVQQTGKINLFQSHKEGYRDGEQRRDFVYVKDICDQVIWFLDHPEVNGIFNAGTGQAQTFNALASAIFKALDMPEKIDYVPTPESIRSSYQYFTEADLAALRNAGYDKTFTTLEDAVTDYIRGYLMNEKNPYL